VLFADVALDVLEGPDQCATEASRRPKISHECPPAALSPDGALVFELEQGLPHDRARHVIAIAQLVVAHHSVSRLQAALGDVGANEPLHLRVERQLGSSINRAAVRHTHKVILS